MTFNDIKEKVAENPIAAAGATATGQHGLGDIKAAASLRRG